MQPSESRGEFTVCLCELRPLSRAGKDSDETVHSPLCAGRYVFDRFVDCANLADATHPRHIPIGSLWRLPFGLRALIFPPLLHAFSEAF